MSERRERAFVRREGREDKANSGTMSLSSRALGGLSAALALLALGLGPGVLEAADIDPGTFVFEASAPGIMAISLAKLENEVCAGTPMRSRTVGGLTSIVGHGEIIDINANMNIQGMTSNGNSGVIAASPIQLQVNAPVDFNGGREETANVEVSRFCMETATPVSLSCGGFDVMLALDPSVTQTPGSFVLTPDQVQGGSFTSDVELSLSLTFTGGLPGSGAPVVVSHTVTYASSGQWAYAPGMVGATAIQSFWSDSDCDGVDDTLVPGTTDFFPGWTPSGMLTEVTFTDQAQGGYLRLEPPVKGN